MSRSRFLNHFPGTEPPSGERPKGDVFAQPGEELPTPVPSPAENVVMLREMLNAVLEENNRLNERVLELQNELDRERAKKLHSG